ncbi:MAG: hypothetical protein M4D80_41945 [Myxococcota bacterium]|nr:hypothetical protein [Myxococcota bacterium]
MPVEFASQAPPDARIERADVIKDIELVDDESARRAEWALIRRMNKAHEGPVDQLALLDANHPRALALLARGLEINSILDSVDGELARLRFQYSKVGQWLDNLSDDLVDNAFIAATGYALGGIWMWIGFAAAGGRLLHALSTYVWVYATTGGGDLFSFRWWFESATASAAEVYSPTSVTTWLRSFGRRDTFVFVWMIAALCGVPQWIVVHGAVIAAVNVSLLALHFTVFRNRRA